MTRSLTIVVICIVVGLPLAALSADPFELLKGRIANSGCTTMKFLSIVESEIFGSIDSTDGMAYLASDGRYNLSIGSEQYLRDASYLYSYSLENNQVIIEPVDRAPDQSELSYLTRFDEHYITTVVKAGKSYRLVALTVDDSDDQPDTLRIELDKTGESIKTIEYFDINGDLNRIRFLEMEFYDSCLTEWFIPQFPDSTERVKL